MMRAPHRIAAGGIIFKDDSVLLVRYRNAEGRTYLVGPGGAVEDGENAYQAVVREMREETGLEVVPQRVLWIEDLQCKRYKMVKIWILCEPVSCDVRQTELAAAEGIIAAGWFTKEQLADEVVFPLPLMQYDWRAFRSNDWQVQCLPSRTANF